jgi:NADPH:quinone reductase-like Zn-dependent oxidoreductase
MQTMRAAVVTRYGAPDVLALRDVARPTPGARDLLIRVRATTVSSGDARVRARRVPEGMASSCASRWAGAGRAARARDRVRGRGGGGRRGVTRFRVGDAVVAFPGAAMGAHAAYVRVPRGRPLAPKPDGLSWEEAAALLFGGTTALHYLRVARVKPGERVLVLGASGAVGVAAVQLARHGGAEVTAVCSAANAALVKELGAARGHRLPRRGLHPRRRALGRGDGLRRRAPTTPAAAGARAGRATLRVVCGLGGAPRGALAGAALGPPGDRGCRPERPEDVRAPRRAGARGAPTGR